MTCGIACRMDEWNVEPRPLAVAQTARLGDTWTGEAEGRGKRTVTRVSAWTKGVKKDPLHRGRKEVRDRARLGRKLRWGQVPLRGLPAGAQVEMPQGWERNRWGGSRSPHRSCEEPAESEGRGWGRAAQHQAQPESGAGIICLLREGIRKGIGKFGGTYNKFPAK